MVVTKKYTINSPIKKEKVLNEAVQDDADGGCGARKLSEEATRSVSDW